MEGAWAALRWGGGLGGAISKWKGPGRCYKQMEGAWAVLQANGRGLGGAISKWKGPGRCDKQMEGAWAML